MSAITRTRQLAERAGTDLKLLGDAALAARVPYPTLAKVRRAQREVRDLISDLARKPNQETPHDGHRRPPTDATFKPQGERR
jgi:hypothetical protein